MKKIIHILASISLVFAFALLWNCTRDTNTAPNSPTTVVKGSVEFDISSIATSKGTLARGTAARSATATDVLKNATAIQMIIEDTSGNIVYPNASTPSNGLINLIRINGDILSPPLSFAPGNYLVTEFVVLDAAGKSLAAAPKAGASAAGLVSQTLNIPFSITAENTNRLSVEVVAVGSLSAADFGYSTFSIITADLSNFLLSAFAYDTSTKNFELTTATATILNQTTNKSYGVISMKASTTSINYPSSASVSDVIQITVEKAGYRTEVVTKTLAYLKTTLTAVPKGAGPLIMVLNKQAFRLVMNLDAADSKSYSGSGNRWTNLATNTYHGTIYGNPTHNTTTGYFTFDGTDDYIDTTKKGQPLAWTVGVWFRLKSHGGHVIYSSINSSSKDFLYDGFNLETNATGVFGFALANNKINIIPNTITYPITPGKWYHAIWSFNGTSSSTVNILINGVFTSHTSIRAGTTRSDEILRLGANEYGNSGIFTGSLFKGDIAKFEMYEGAMSRAELESVYNSQKSRFGL